jgi:N-acetylneuraminic acid mutarotase
MRTLLLILLLPLSGIICQNKILHTADPMPHPVAGAVSLKWGNQIYIIGGYSSDTQDYVKWIQSYDVSVNQWGEYKNMQYPRYGLNAAIKYDTVYCYGGIHDTSYSNSSVEKWDISFLSASAVFDHNAYFNRIFSSGAIVGNNYYIIGGNPYLESDSSDLPYIVEYNTLTKNVTYVLNDSTFGEELPEQQMISVVDNDIYIFGGVQNGLPSKKIYKFNTITHQLDELIIELNEPRAGGIAVKGSAENEIFLIGGFHEQSAALNSVELFKIENQGFSVNEAEGIITPRKHFVGENIDGIIYIFGGVDEKGDWVEDVELFSTIVTAGEKLDNTPMTFELNQNYPNPFNPTTKIKFQVPSNLAFRQGGVKSEMSNVKLTVYDILGSVIATLVDEQKQPGSYTENFNGNGLANGVYFYKLTVSGSAAHRKNIFSETKKMVLLK